MKFFLLACFLALHATIYGVLVGGRPNAISQGNNAFAGVINPANAVWIDDRIDIGAFWFYQRLKINNRDNNPIFPKGETDLTYKVRNLFTSDIAIHKKTKRHPFERSFSLATYTTPTYGKNRTKIPIPLAGTTPVKIDNKIQAISAIFSFKVHPNHSLGVSIDYFLFTYRRNGFQRSNNPLRSVSPGHVTNNGFDHSSGIGLSFGWHWNMTKKLQFGAAYAKRSCCGQYRKYRGYEPHHARNYIPQTFGAGFKYKFNTKLAAHLEVLWSNLSGLPQANNNVLGNGKLNLHKRGSDKSPGPGFQDVTIFNIAIGYKVNSILALGASLSHRIRLKKGPIFISHSYVLQATYDILSFGANMRCKKHDIFLSVSYGFPNKVSGDMPNEIGGGRFNSRKDIAAASISWGYLY